MEREAVCLSTGLDELEREIGRYVRALGQGTITLKCLEQEVQQREKDKGALQIQYDGLQRKIRERAIGEYDVDILMRNLQDFQEVFHALAPQKQAKVLQCLVKDVIAYPDKLVLNIFELADVAPGSQQGKDWLPGQDSNLRPAG